MIQTVPLVLFLEAVVGPECIGAAVLDFGGIRIRVAAGGREPGLRALLAGKLGIHAGIQVGEGCI